MKRNVIILVIVVATVAAALFFASRMATPPSAQGSAMETAAVAATEGKQAPDFELQRLDGKAVKLSNLRGKAVLVNFWATWCAPCKIEMPWFSEMNNKYKAQGLEI